ncbi:TolC family protein [Paraburkholderia sp. RL17-337-BIB-A]|uniref:TolC family protein n=1 Tax=Paraburkholderia sp. RL17-337-BIB-A TaxID=3031636 RepID=UPI0038BBFE54
MPLTIGTPSCRRAPLRARSLFAALILASAAAYSQEAPVTLDAALQAATDRSASMQAAQASVSASSEAAVKAGQLPNPMLAAGIDNLPINGPQAFTIGQNILTMRRIGIEQEWVSPEKRRLRSALANQVVDKERAGFLAQLVNVRQQTATAWLNAAYAKKAVSLQQELVGHMTHELAATQASYRGAKASASDVVQAQLMLAQTQDQLLKAQQTLQTALISLSRWTAGAVTDVAGEPPAPQSVVASLPPDQLREVEPALMTATADMRVADADTAVANSNRNTDWTWNVSYLQGGGSSRFVSVGVSIPLPINRKNVEDRDAAEKAQLGTKARLMYEDAQRQVEADIRTQSATLASGRERITNLTYSLLPAADQRVQLAAAAYRAGTGSLADTFAARRAQLDAELQVLDLQRDVSQTWAQLEYQVVPASTSVSQ